MISIGKHIFIVFFVFAVASIFNVHEVKSYKTIRIKQNYKSIKDSSIIRSQLKPRASSSDEWQEDDSAVASNEDVPNLHQKIYNNLDQAVGEIVTASAIDTASYYMLEFRDDVSQKWMVSFLDYKSVGFIDGDWQLYLKEMIKLDLQKAKIYLDPPRVSARHQPTEEEQNLKAMYIHEFEPRKIAHKILAIREDISNELMEDFGCITLENKEAVKFANNRITSGVDYAEINRGATRYFDGGSTPLRGKTYREMSLMMTNIALDIVRAELNLKQDKASLSIIEEILDRISSCGDELDPFNKMLLENKNPQTFLEEICYYGLTQNNLKDGKSNSNFLKISKSLLLYREALAKSSIKILAEQNKELRYMYKLIKDLGGFKSFDLRRKKTEVRIVNMKEEEEEDLKQQQERILLAAASTAISGEINKGTESKSEQQQQSDLNTSPSTTISSTTDDDDSSLFDTISIGPMMM